MGALAFVSRRAADNADGLATQLASGTDAAFVAGVPLPRLVPQGSALGQAIGRWHATLVWVLVGLVSLHVLAALVHYFVYHDGVMRRMFTRRARAAYFAVMMFWPDRSGGRFIERLRRSKAA